MKAQTKRCLSFLKGCNMVNSIPHALSEMSLAKGAKFSMVDFGYLIDYCNYSGLGVSTLLNKVTCSNIVRLNHASRYMNQPINDRIIMPRFLVYRLPVNLIDLLDGFLFLRSFFLTHYHVRNASPPKVILIHNLKPDWVYDTLVNLMPRNSIFINNVATVPVDASVELFSSLLETCLHPTYSFSEPEFYRNYRGLTISELQVLRDCIRYNMGISAQAYIKGKSCKTLYAQRRSAMGKLGVKSLFELINLR